MFLSPRSIARLSYLPVLLAALTALFMGLMIPKQLGGQRILTEPEAAITLARGTSALIDYPGELTRVSVADPAVAEAVILSPQEVLLNGLGLGATSLFLWDSAGSRRLYSVEVTADVGTLQVPGPALPGRGHRGLGARKYRHRLRQGQRRIRGPEGHRAGAGDGRGADP